MSSTPSVALSLKTVLGIPTAKVPIGFDTLVSYVLPPVICYLILAVLAITPQTRTGRVALWPVTALLALRAAVSVDMSTGNPEREFLHIDLALSMVCIVVRTLHWALAKEPLVRHLRPKNTPKSVVLDALDLASNLRGYGWNWSRGLHVPRETRPANRIAFAFCTFLSAVAHALICGALHRTVLTLAPVGSGPTPGGSTIFDQTLPPLVRYLRASIISTMTAFSIYAVLQMGYDLCTLPAILFLGHDPVQWPPVFDAPWLSTSLSDFWGRRWHQWFRHTFVFVGGYPLSFLFGRMGIVFGAFLSSAAFHYIALSTLSGGQAEIGRMLIAFGVMAPGILAERAFHQWTGKRVGGVVGCVWTMTWLVLWGNVMVEGFARAGMFGCSSFVDSFSPVRVSVEGWVSEFDAWLHADRRWR